LGAPPPPPRQGSTPPPAPPAASKPAAATEKAAPAPSAGAGAAGSLFDKLPAPKLPEQAAALGALKDLLGKAPGALEGLLDGKEAPAGSALGRLQGLFAPKDVGGAAPPPAKPAADKPKVKAEPLYEDDDFSAPKVCVWARVCVCGVRVWCVCAWSSLPVLLRCPSLIPFLTIFTQSPRTWPERTEASVPLTRSPARARQPAIKLPTPLKMGTQEVPLKMGTQEVPLQMGTQEVPLKMGTQEVPLPPSPSPPPPPPPPPSDGAV
jgi:hypothetical protein